MDPMGMKLMAYFMNFRTKFAMPSDEIFLTFRMPVFGGVTPFSNSGAQDDITCLGGNFYKSSFATATGRVYLYICVCVYHNIITYTSDWKGYTKTFPLKKNNAS